jgi:hypothetical protein
MPGKPGEVSFDACPQRGGVRTPVGGIGVPQGGDDRVKIPGAVEQHYQTPEHDVFKLHGGVQQGGGLNVAYACKACSRNALRLSILFI